MAADPEQLHLTNAQLKTFSILIATLINKLQKEGGLSSSALQLKDEEFLKWLQQNMSSKELNRIIFGQYCQYGGADLDKYDELFVNRKNGTDILDYILSMDFLASVAVYAIAQKKGEEAKKPYFPETLGLSEADKDDIISFCVQCTDERKYPDLVTEQQYKDFLNNIRNALCYRFAELEINSLKAKTFEAKTSQLQDHIRITMNTMTAGSYEIKPIFNKTVNYWVNGDKKSKVLPSLLAEYYSTLSTLLKRYGSKPQITEADHQEFITEVSKYIKKFEEEFNSDKGGFFDNSAHYAWHMQHIQRLQKLGLWSQVPLPQPEIEEVLPLDFSVKEDLEEFLEKFIVVIMEKSQVTREEAERRAKFALAQSESEEIPKESTSSVEESPSSSSSTPIPAAPPLPPKDRVIDRAAKALGIALGDTINPTERQRLANSMVKNRGVNQKAIRTALDQMEKKKEAAPKVQSIPAATKYGPLEISKVQEPATVYIFSHLPPQEELAKLESGYLLVKDAKLVKTRLYYVNPKGLVECRSEAKALESLCMHLDQTLDKKLLLTQLRTFFVTALLLSTAPFNVSAEDAEKRAKTVLEEIEKENAPIEGSLSSCLPSAAPLSPEAEFKRRLKNSLRSNIEKDAKDSKTAANLVDTFMATAGLKCVTLDAKQHQELILKKCGGHNYKAAESVAPVAESSSSSSQASVPVAESSSSSTRTPSPTAAPQGSLPSVPMPIPAPMGSVERRPSLGVSQGAPAKKYNFDGYEVTLLKKGESLPEDAAIQERMLYAKWDSNTKELTVKFKQGEGTPISFPMKISNPTNIKLLTEALENPDNTNWEKVKGFITFRTEDPDMGQRNSVAFRRPPQVLEKSDRRSVSPEKAKEPVGDGSKEKGKEGATENPRIVSVSPLSFLPPIEEKKEPTGDNSKDKVRLSDSPRVSFMPPPVEEEKEGPTPPDDTQNKASSMGLRSSKE